MVDGETMPCLDGGIPQMAQIGVAFTGHRNHVKRVPT
jgi:hypothetical protein